MSDKIEPFESERFSFTSVQEYLNVQLKERTIVTDEEIIALKKRYWKLWYKYYRREQRKLKKEYAIRLSVVQESQLDQQRGDYSRSKFIYLLIEKGLAGEVISSLSSEAIGIIQQHLIAVMDLLEELRDENNLQFEKEIVERLSILEKSINELQKSLSNDHKREKY